MLENTDKAVANILDQLAAFSTQIHSEAFESLAQVATLSAQGDIMTAWVIFWVGVVVFLFGVLLVAFACTGNTADGTAGGGVFMWLITAVLMCISLSTIFSPLDNAKAKDGKVALAYELLQKIK